MEELWDNPQQNIPEGRGEIEKVKLERKIMYFCSLLISEVAFQFLGVVFYYLFLRKFLFLTKIHEQKTSTHVLWLFDIYSALVKFFHRCLERIISNTFDLLIFRRRATKKNSLLSLNKTERPLKKW